MPKTDTEPRPESWRRRSRRQSIQTGRLRGQRSRPHCRQRDRRITAGFLRLVFGIPASTLPDKISADHPRLPWCRCLLRAGQRAQPGRLQIRTQRAGGRWPVGFSSPPRRGDRNSDTEERERDEHHAGDGARLEDATRRCLVQAASGRTKRFGCSLVWSSTCRYIPPARNRWLP